jgi:hypothetical protein
MSYRSCVGNPIFDDVPGASPAFPVGSTITIPLPLEIATTPLAPAYVAHILDGLTGNLTGQYVLPGGTWLYSGTLQVSNVDPTAVVVDTRYLVKYDGITIAYSDDGINSASCIVNAVAGSVDIQSTTAVMPACPIISDGTKILDVTLEVNPSAGAGWEFPDGALTAVTQKLVRIA